MAEAAALTPDIASRKRRVSLTLEEIALIQAALSPLTVELAKALRYRLDQHIAEELDPKHRAAVAAYRAAVHVRDGEIEIDDDAEVSTGDDPGAYVMVWTWVDAMDAGVCTECGDTDADNGEGYDGRCGRCADRRENALAEKLDQAMLT